MTSFNFVTTLSLILGFVPALVWLWFWLKEDKASPEPKSMIFKTFIAGGLVVMIAFILQNLSVDFLRSAGFGLPSSPVKILATSTLLASLGFLLVWATIEEVIKFLAAYFTAFRNRHYNEPVDALMYMVIVAIGFAAVENTLFLFDSSVSNNSLAILMTGNMRFLGATVVHIISSSIVGGFMALTFYSASKIKKILSLALGLILAVFLHAGFNFLIINSNGSDMLYIFAGLWLLVIVIIYIFEQAKQTTRNPIESEPSDY